MQTSVKQCKMRSPTSMDYRKKHDSALHKSEALMESRGKLCEKEKMLQLKLHDAKSGSRLRI